MSAQHDSERTARLHKTALELLRSDDLSKSYLAAATVLRLLRAFEAEENFPAQTTREALCNKRPLTDLITYDDLQPDEVTTVFLTGERGEHPVSEQSLTELLKSPSHDKDKVYSAPVMSLMLLLHNAGRESQLAVFRKGALARSDNSNDYIRAQQKITQQIEGLTARRPALITGLMQGFIWGAAGAMLMAACYLVHSMYQRMLREEVVFDMYERGDMQGIASAWVDERQELNERSFLVSFFKPFLLLIPLVPGLLVSAHYGHRLFANRKQIEGLKMEQSMRQRFFVDLEEQAQLLRGNGVVPGWQ
jgi:hypothetical protein